MVTLCLQLKKRKVCTCGKPIGTDKHIDCSQSPIFCKIVRIEHLPEWVPSWSVIQNCYLDVDVDLTEKQATVNSVINAESSTVKYIVKRSSYIGMKISLVGG